MLHAIANAIKRFVTGYLLAILVATGAIAALVITTRMNQMSGVSQAATEEGQLLMGWAAIVVHVVGVVLCGLVAGAAAKRHYRKLARAMGAIVIFAAVISAMNIMGFMASEVLSVTETREEQIAQRAKDREARREAAAKRLELQAKLAEKQLAWNKDTAGQKDVGRRERKEIRKDMQEASRKIIAEVGNDFSQPQETQQQQTLTVPDGGAKLISNATFGLVSVESAQTVRLAGITILLLVLEVVLWPTAGYCWGGFAGAAQPAPVASPPMHFALPPAGQLQLPAPAALAEDTPPPPLAPPTPKITEDADAAALNFIEWARATGRAGHRYWGSSIDEAYADYCAGQNRLALDSDKFREALGRLAEGKRTSPVIKDRAKSPSGNKLTYYEVKPSPKPKAPPIDRRAEEIKPAKEPDIRADITPADAQKSATGSAASEAAKPDIQLAKELAKDAAPGGGRVILGPFDARFRGRADLPTGGSPLAYHLIAEVRESRAQKAMLRRECQRAQRRMNLPRREARSNRVAQRMAA